jgi:large subunit ribosomal protein L25
LELIELKAKIRATVGNSSARAMRRHGQVPAILYGPETEPVMLTVAASDIEQVLKKGKSGQVVLNLVIQNGETSTRPAMIKELQTHPLSRKFLHVDFYEIAMDRKINVNIPVVTTGQSKGVEDGGILQIVRRELEVLCLPFEIPETIEIDISDLDIGDSIHVSDISLEGDVEFLEDAHFAIVTVLSPILEVEEEELEEEELEEGLEEEEKAEAAPETEGES